MKKEAFEDLRNLPRIQKILSCSNELALSFSTIPQSNYPDELKIFEEDLISVMEYAKINGLNFGYVYNENKMTVLSSVEEILQTHKIIILTRTFRTPLSKYTVINEQLESIKNNGDGLNDLVIQVSIRDSKYVSSLRKLAKLLISNGYTMESRNFIASMKLRTRSKIRKSSKKRRHGSSQQSSSESDCSDDSNVELDAKKRHAINASNCAKISGTTIYSRDENSETEGRCGNWKTESSDSFFIFSTNR